MSKRVADVSIETLQASCKDRERSIASADA